MSYFDDFEANEVLEDRLDEEETSEDEELDEMDELDVDQNGHVYERNKRRGFNEFEEYFE